MESLRNEPVIMTGSGGMGTVPSGYGYGGGEGILGAVLAASLLGGSFGGYGKNYGYQPSLVDIGTLFAEKSASDTRRDVKDSESEIRESIHNQTFNNSSEFRGVDNKLFQLQSESLAARYEGIIANKDSTNILTNRVDRESDLTRKYVSDVQVNMDRQFCDLKHELTNSLNAIRERELQTEVDQLRRDNFSLRQDQQNSVLAAILKAVTPNP